MGTLAGGVGLGLATPGAAPAVAAPELADPFRWLEDIHGESALAWVRAQNAATAQALDAGPWYQALHARPKTIFDAKGRIPYVGRHADHYYNFWRDEAHVRGLWRRTTLDQFRLAEPAWDTIIDLDVLAREENENWVWAGAQCLPPRGERCLVQLSRGGGDAIVVREYDLAARTFVEDGFVLPEAKTVACWLDRDTLAVATNFGAASLTTSGYGRIVKQWRRGTPLAEASTIYEAQANDLSASGYKSFTRGFEYVFVKRQISFFASELFLRKDGRLLRIDKPDDASAFTVAGQLLLSLRSDWSVAGATYLQGSLLAIDFARFLQGARTFETLFAPSPTRSLDAMTNTASTVLITELDNVVNRLVELRHVDGTWQRRAVTAPAFGALGVNPADRYGSDQYFLTVNDFLTPPSLYLGQAGSDERELLKSMPAWFDASLYQVQQYAAASKDGTQVPYFVVMAKQSVFNGNNPTLLYGYGGFEIAMRPAYSAVTGEAWLKHGGVYVLANIRGGGEFGPRWHQAALREKRQASFDDFLAVAEDVIARKLTSARHLGIMGGSNGGLLVAAAMTQRPELFNAVVCQVPLLDMRRYAKLLAGASWIEEYGDPDQAADWAAMSRYSPYHNVSADKRYPRMLLTTSTRDDRVHPGHARKMAALMQALGHDVLYWENLDGGHAGASDNAQQARMWALAYAFLLAQLR